LKSPQLKNILVTVTTQLRLNVTTHIKTECHIPNGIVFNSFILLLYFSLKMFSWIIPLIIGADIRNANEKGILIQANVLKGSHPITGASIKYIILFQTAQI
jgi:calcium-activated chloride channel regulator 4